MDLHCCPILQPNILENDQPDKLKFLKTSLGQGSIQWISQNFKLNSIAKSFLI